MFNMARLISPRVTRRCARLQVVRGEKQKRSTLNAHGVNEPLTLTWSVRCVQMQIVHAGGVKRV